VYLLRHQIIPPPIIAFVIDFRKVRKAITGRRGRFSTGTTVMVSIFIGIALLINAISIGNYHRFDVTGVSQFTLTSQTKDVLKQTEIPIKALCFFIPNDEYGIAGYATTLLDEYKNFTDQLSIEVIDPDEHPDQARQYGIIQYQTVVFESEIGRRMVLPEQIVDQAEHAFTSAILEVTGIAQKKVYFLTGHGESDIDEDYSQAKQGLLDNLYNVGTLDLAITHSIPDSCNILIITAPQKALSTDEYNIINDYLNSGGWAMFMLNPDPPQNIGQLIAPWGLNIESGTIVDPSSSMANDINSPIIPRIRDFFGFTSIYFPGPTALIPQPEFTPTVITGAGSDTPLQIVWTSENSFIEMYSLARTSGDSWLETNYSAGQPPTYNEGTELNGPLDIGFLIFMSPPVDAEGQPTAQVLPTRLIVIGDSDFASNQHFYEGDNGNLFLNCVELLTTGTELISIERKVLPFRRMLIVEEEETFIRISSIVLLPLLVLIGGGIIWWRRR
ncbi:GldG family protein, partial [Chloroflexota bacterium]